QPTMSFGDLPSQFNWANYGGNWVTPVKDQAYPVYCGSCYIFAIWGAFEASIDIASGKPNTDIDLSEQYGLSCINAGCNGCGGGWGSTMINNIVSTSPSQSGNGVNGVPIESCMPYTATDTVPCSDKCTDWDFHTEPILDPDDKLWQIANWGAFTISEDNPNDWYVLKTYLLDKGPIAVSMYWSNGLQSFVDTHHNPNDVYENDDSGYTNHLILCVGWVDDASINGGGYWILKNSHGTSQGYGGFCNLAYGCLNLGVSECDWIIAEDWPEEEQGEGPAPVIEAVFADFNYDPEYNHPGEEIEFTDISDGDVTMWEWDFNGDGVIDSNKKNPTWTYNMEGSYEVDLRVWSHWGLNSDRMKTVNVKQNWPAVVVIKPDEYPDPAHPKNDLEIHFDSRYSYDPDGSIVSCLWDFGDGATSPDRYLYHIFPEPDKIYEVTLTLTDNDEGTASDTCTIKIDQTVPPETSIHHGLGSSSSDYYGTTQKISFSAADWTRVSNTYYRIDGGNWIIYNPSEQQYIPVDNEGEHTVEAYSVDYWGNEEKPVSETFWIDKTNPTLYISLDGNLDDGWYINEITVTLDGDDDLSGVDQLFYRYKTSGWVEYNNPFVIDDRQGVFTLEAMAVDNAGNQVTTEEEIYIKYINSPTVPSISGPTSGKPGEELTYKILSYDTGNDIYYYIDWGDGNTDGWLGPYSSGEERDISHIYNLKDSFVIKVKAKNQYDVESDWGTHSISMPKNKNIDISSFLLKFLGRYPILYYLLNLKS
ncbi:MAG: PKD domain-containing protein, partial [Candidatus Thermoplasmatota archaeon]|nr:PKD domain-containing protein [Candidatus Thermoplasmatota archaeon]